MDQGISALQQALTLSPESTLFLGQLGQAYARAGKTDEARDVLLRLEEMSRQRYVSPYHIAYVYTGLGEYDRALDLLERAYEERAERCSASRARSCSPRYASTRGSGRCSGR